MIDFVWPWAILAFPLPFLIYYFAPRRDQEEPALLIPFYRFIKDDASVTADSKRKDLTKVLLMLIGWIALVTSATKPQFIGEPITLPTSGRDLMLAVDVSGSMGTEDMELNGEKRTRLAIVKNIVGDFVEQREGDRLGLILFGTRAYLQTPLTFDRKTVKTLLEESPLGIAGGKTAIGDAIGLGVKKLKDRPAENRVLILLTDGVNNVGEIDPVQASKIAAQEGVRIYTIGFGSDSLVIPGLLFQRTVNPSAELDSETLIKIAEATGGTFQRAKSARELSEIYEELNKLEPINQDPKTFRPSKALFHIPLSIATIISLVLTITSLGYIQRMVELSRRYRELPKFLSGEKK